VADLLRIKSVIVCLKHRPDENVGRKLLYRKADRLCAGSESTIGHRARVGAPAFTSKDLCRSAVIEIIHAKYMACTGVDCISWRSMMFLAFYSAPWVPCPSKRYQFLS